MTRVSIAADRAIIREGSECWPALGKEATAARHFVGPELEEQMAFESKPAIIGPVPRR
jgi:hypothetical protein